MKREFKARDHVSWNSEAGRIRGTIQKKVTAPTKFKTYMARVSKEEPQYLVKSDATGHLAMHKAQHSPNRCQPARLSEATGPIKKEMMELVRKPGRP